MDRNLPASMARPPPLPTDSLNSVKNQHFLGIVMFYSCQGLKASLKTLYRKELGEFAEPLGTSEIVSLGLGLPATSPGPECSAGAVNRT